MEKTAALPLLLLLLASASWPSALAAQPRLLRDAPNFFSPPSASAATAPCRRDDTNLCRDAPAGLPALPSAHGQGDLPCSVSTTRVSHAHAASDASSRAGAAGLELAARACANVPALLFIPPAETCARGPPPVAAAVARTCAHTWHYYAMLDDRAFVCDGGGSGGDDGSALGSRGVAGIAPPKAIAPLAELLQPACVGRDATPHHVHIALGPDPSTSVWLSWVAGDTDASMQHQQQELTAFVGTASGAYSKSALGSRSTPSAGDDTCGAPANMSDLLHYIYPGHFGCVLVTGLAPATLYFAIVGRSGAAPSRETTFVTAARAPTDNGTARFAAFGDLRRVLRWPGAVTAVASTASSASSHTSLLGSHLSLPS